MKKLITALSVLTLGTTVGNLSSALNTNQKMESVNNILNQGNKKISNNLPLASITKNNISNSLTQSDLKTLVAGGENYYQYYFAYHVIGLSHKVLQDINSSWRRSRSRSCYLKRCYPGDSTDSCRSGGINHRSMNDMTNTPIWQW